MMGKPLQPPPQYMLVRGHKLCKNSYESKAKGVSISAFILSVLIYISVFYLFNLSPSLIFNSSKFWFILSNTLIIIIAADYESFSSSADRPDDPYDEYVAKSRQPMSGIYHQPYYISTPRPSSPLHLENTYHDEDEVGVAENNMIFSASVRPKEEVTKELSVVDDTWTIPTQDAIWESISKEAEDKKVQKDNDHRNIISYADRKKEKKFRRTVSEKLPAATHVAPRERKNAIHRWESERYEPLVEDNEINDEQQQERENDKEGEFASMTNEELNKRVEEFIQKFNRHIRLERDINF